MKKKARILAALMSLMVFLVCQTGVASAQEVVSPPPDVQSAVSPGVNNGIEVNMQDITLQSSSLIKQWNCFINNNFDGTVNISGQTYTYNNVDYLDVRVYLQRWNGSTWVDVTSRFYSNSASDYVSGSDQISITSGNYYRCRAAHNAQSGSNSNNTASTSSSIYVQ